MKKALRGSCCGAAALLFFSTGAFAQSSVTLYGIVDTSVRYLSSANATNGSLISMGDGVETPSRWGLKGSEDLGGGTSAIFRLEDGFQLYSGKLASTNTLFGRHAYVGLSNKQYGTLTFGRQQSPFFELMGNIYDPMTVGDYWQDSWVYNPAGPFLTVNNSVKYTNDFGGLHVSAMYSFGGVAGSMAQNSMYGLAASYAMGPLQAMAGWQQAVQPRQCGARLRVHADGARAGRLAAFAGSHGACRRRHAAVRRTGAAAREPEPLRR
jgi:predicted porin